MNTLFHRNINDLWFRLFVHDQWTIDFSKFWLLSLNICAVRKQFSKLIFGPGWNPVGTQRLHRGDPYGYNVISLLLNPPGVINTTWLLPVLIEQIILWYHIIYTNDVRPVVSTARVARYRAYCSALSSSHRGGARAYPGRIAAQRYI
jgi:hypothetical protein